MVITNIKQDVFKNILKIWYYKEHNNKLYFVNKLILLNNFGTIAMSYYHHLEI
jgi:hypothetical protein